MMLLLDALRTARQEIQNSWRDTRAPGPTGLSDNEKKILGEIHTDGVSVVPHFYTAEKCAILRAEVDRLLELYREQLFVDEENADHRVFGANLVSPIVAEFYNDAFITKIIHAHEQTNDIVGLALAARLEYHAGNTKGSGNGWHRDRTVDKQIKALLYLSDVEAGNGPYQYLKGSHRHINIVMDCLTEGFTFNQSRFTNEALQKLIDKKYNNSVLTLPAPAGTLIFSNTRGLHRGTPIKHGTRHALTNYYWSNMPIPEHIKKVTVRAKDL